MRTLFIDRKNAELAIDRGRLLVRLDNTRPQFSVPTHILEILVVSAAVKFTSTLLAGLTQAGVTTIFLNPRRAEACAITHGLMHNNAERRLRQYCAITNETLRFTYTRQLVRDKVRGQRAVLKKALNKRPDCRYTLTTGIDRLTGIIERLASQSSIDSIRGMEGAAGASYFEAYKSLFAPTLDFTGRNRRPPCDPVNVMLSLTYTMLHAEAMRALIATGFDPMLGIYHEPAFGRESLACDLVELFRPLAERWVWQLFANETIRPEHFSLNQDNEKPCMLGKRGREIYYQEYESMARGWRRLMRRAARNWLTLLEKDVPVQRKTGGSNGIP